MRSGCLSIGPSMGIALLNNNNLVTLEPKRGFLLNKDGDIPFAS